jgi:hypothetical protein
MIALLVLEIHLAHPVVFVAIDTIWPVQLKVADASPRAHVP